MSLTESQKSTLRKKAKANLLEVEDLLKIARIGGSEDIELLRSLSADCDWSETGFEGDHRVVRLARWAEVVCEYLDGGYDRLCAIATSSELVGTHAAFCIAVLEEFRTAESVAAMLFIAQGLHGLEGEQANRLRAKIASALNLILALKNPPVIDEETRKRVRDYLHGLLEVDLQRHERATTIYALRGVGDESSLERLKSIRRFESPWKDCPALTIRTIKKRLAADENA